MILALLLAAASPTAVDAEREFAARAQTHGQWTAFREFAADDGVMFVPEQVSAQQWLKGRADPPQPVMWWPAEAYASCDGKYAVTTGPWVRNGGKLVGYFTTIWQKQPDGRWKWILDHGDVLPKPRPASDDVRLYRADCSKTVSPALLAHPGGETVAGNSPDGSLLWLWSVQPTGQRQVRVMIREGSSLRVVINDQVAAGQ